jgi:hypothetical protein
MTGHHNDKSGCTHKKAAVRPDLRVAAGAVKYPKTGLFFRDGFLFFRFYFAVRLGFGKCNKRRELFLYRSLY